MSNTENISKRFYPPLAGCLYIAGLTQLHQNLKPNWYLEVGSLKGSSLQMVSANTIVVDPKLIVEVAAFARKREVHLFQMTSDDFFASGRASDIAPSIDFSFLDGMHLFEFLLRDFINTEKLCSSKSVIAMHDCIPISAPAARREWDTTKTKAWTGDVWKLVPILRKYRPDLTLTVYDCPPSGLTVVSNLDPNNTVLSDNYDAILAEYLELELESFGPDRLLEILDIQSSLAAHAFKKDLVQL